MKHFLALLAAVGGMVVCHAQVPPASQAAPESRPAVVPKTAPAPSVAPHQLSAEQRAQLRRQLLEYSKLAGK